MKSTFEIVQLEIINFQSRFENYNAHTELSVQGSENRTSNFTVVYVFGDVVVSPLKSILKKLFPSNLSLLKLRNSIRY